MKNQFCLKPTSLFSRAIPFLALLVFAAALHTGPAFAQGTTFTYQGRLDGTNGPVNGLYDFTFDLYDAPAAGTYFTTSVTNGVPVTNGLFTVKIDYSTAVYFNGDPRWLEITVRSNGGFEFPVTLSPRQQITPAPYAMFAGNAAMANSASSASWSGLTGLPAGFADGVDNDTTYLAGTGLTLIGGTFNLNTNVTDGRYWKLTGNTGTGNFLGSTDNQPLEFRVNNTRAMRIQFANASTGPNITAGHAGNIVSGGTFGNTISGGGRDGDLNRIELPGSFGSIGGGAGNYISADFGTIGGGRENQVFETNGTIAGGVFNYLGGSHEASTIGGGVGNSVIFAQAGTIGGGINNVINSEFAPTATIGGGYQNYIEDVALGGVISGGSNNRLGGRDAVIGGGSINTNSGDYATVPGGTRNLAAGDYSFAAGRRAKALHNGTFIWADDQDANFQSTATRQFLIRAANGVGINTPNPNAVLHLTGSTTNSLQILQNFDDSATTVSFSTGFRTWRIGQNRPPDSAGAADAFFIHDVNASRTRLLINTVGNIGFGTNSPAHPLHMASGAHVTAAGTWTSVSDRNAKEQFESIDPVEILAKVAALPITRWKYKVEEDGVKHIGPTAQDFREIFGFGESDTAIAMVDPDGVALAAIQGLNQKLEAKDREIDELRQRLSRLEQLLNHNAGGEYEK